MMTKDEAISLARKIQSLIDHKDTPSAERDTARRRLKDLTVRYELSDADLAAPEPLEPDVAPDPSYDDILKSILEQAGVPEDSFHELLGANVSKMVRGVWLLGDLLNDKTDHVRLGRSITEAVLSIVQKGE